MKAKNQKSIVIALAIFTLLTFGGAASADTYGTVTVTVDAISPTLTMDSWVVPYDSDWYNGNTGKFQLTFSDATAGVPDLIGQTAFCMEVETIQTGETVTAFNVVDLFEAGVASGPADTSQGPIGTGKADAIAELWGRHVDSVNSNITAAAFQLCVWELVYEDLYVTSPPGWDVTSGKFSSQDSGNADAAAAITQANLWLDSLDGTGPMANVYGLSKDGKQDMVVEAVPEPATMSLLGLGGLALLARRRRGVRSERR